MKVTLSQVESNWFVFKEVPAYKRNLRTPDMNRVQVQGISLLK